MPDKNPLGTFLVSRRTRLDPASFGFAGGRRRTRGLRREEVAQRAAISATWYTWLEQGRGGSPSADALERIARALALTEAEREHLFLLGLGRPPGVRHDVADGNRGEVTPQLQRLLDALTHSPAIVRTPSWDVVAWNRAAAAVLTDYGALPPERRNVLRLLFCDPRVRDAQPEWEAVARFVVGVFRADAVRAGAEVSQLVEELRRCSSEFARLWEDNDVRAHGDGVKHLHLPGTGPVALEYSAFAVDGRPDLSLVVYNPATAEDRARVAALLGDVPA